MQPLPDWATPPQRSPKADNRQTRSSGSKAPLIGFLTIWKLTKAMLGSSLIGMGPLEMPVWGEPWGLSDTRLSLMLPCSSVKARPPALSLPEPWPQLPPHLASLSPRPAAPTLTSFVWVMGDPGLVGPTLEG